MLLADLEIFCRRSNIVAAVFIYIKNYLEGGLSVSVTISHITPHSIAQKYGLHPGDKLLTINGHDIVDVLDYQFYADEVDLTLRVKQINKPLVRVIRLHKQQYQDLGLEFETYLMDKQKSCTNKCIFCFIDQLPKGMRESLYFKDDDSRLSFLFGNYVTMTNMQESELDRIIAMHITPINVSVHTTNPELRCKMLNNRFAGNILERLKKLTDAGIALNCQLVLCPGYNDGNELRRTLDDLTALPNIISIACVPFGQTKFRQGLTPIESYTKQTASETIAILEEYGDKTLKEHGRRLVFASDEFYLTAQKTIPQAEFYEDFSQIENGVGMISLLVDEFMDALNHVPADQKTRRCSIATGMSAAPTLQKLADAAMQKFKGLDCKVYPITNHFFGETITVTGLLTGTDLKEQLNEKELGSHLLLSCNMLRSPRMHSDEADVFLDDMTVKQLSDSLDIPITITETGGEDLLSAMLKQ